MLRGRRVLAQPNSAAAEAEAASSRCVALQCARAVHVSNISKQQPGLQKG